MNIQHTILKHNSVKNEGFTIQDTKMKDDIIMSYLVKVLNLEHSVT
jgi:hypothetical protein